MPEDFLKLPPASLLPEWRQNPITGQWVAIAPERGARPVESVRELHFPPLYESCPFCAGQEHQTPPELFAVRAADSHADRPGWRVRVVPNRYPAVRELEWDADRFADAHTPRPGFGKHELIIESAHHESSLANLPPEHIRDVVSTWRQRIEASSADRRFAYAHVFKNHGAAAGASVIHSHSQLIALPFVPPSLGQELDGASAYHRRRNRCGFCDLIRTEIEVGTRVVSASPRMVAVVAYAGRQPYETWILPRRHRDRFDTLDDEESTELATMLWTVLNRLSRAIPSLAYNLILHTVPFHREPSPSFHWHLEILPRTAQVAGFEWGTGVYINTMRPESAAEQLRRCRDGSVE